MVIANKTISYGSSGSEVKKLQEKLNANGYSLDVDGEFGAKTQAAVKDYQKKNNLSVDGIVGNATWGALNSSSGTSSSKTSSSSVSSNNQSVTGFNTPKPQYEKSSAVINAEDKLNAWETNKPSEYESLYAQDIDRILKNILNREEFDYKLSSDPLYEQYKELYLHNGKKAMMDAMGNASALTGGYGSSYAVTAGNQAYEEYLTQLNDIALDLRDRAYDEYKDENSRLLDDITLLRSLDGDDYEKYLQQLQQYYDEGDYLLNKLSNMTDSEFELFAKELEAWENDREYAFREYQDKLDREEFEEEMAFKKSEAQREQANADRSYALSVSKAASSGSSSSSSSSSSSGSSSSSSKKTSFYPLTYDEFCLRTGFSAILTESEFLSSEKYKEKYDDDYTEYLKAMYIKYQ